MRIALQAHGLSKRFVAGAGSCLASATVLRGVDLTVQSGESIAVVGIPGSGKSTLLLALAGLLSVDAGEIRWFGECGRGAGLRRAIYHIASADLIRRGAFGEQHIHLVDVGDAAAIMGRVEQWIAARADDGDAVISATRDATYAREWATRVLELRNGKLVELAITARSRARVAEAVRAQHM